MNKYGFDYGQHLLETIGSFWTAIYKDQDVLYKYMDGLSTALGQKYIDFLEYVRTLSINDIPVLHTEKWKLLTFKESELNQNTATILKYGGSEAFNNTSAVYGAQPANTQYKEDLVFSYGGYAAGEYYAFPVDLTDIDAYITNRIYAPSLVWSKGVDFQITTGVILFTKNPFDEALLPKRNIVDSNGAVIDREVAVWVFNAKEDKEFLWKYYGTYFNIKLDSSENYRDFLKAALAIFTVGPKLNILVGLLTALFGLPVIKEEEETVQEIITDDTTYVITDKHVYRVPVELNPVIVVGATLPIFTSLTNTVTILDNITTPNWWRNYKFLPLPVQILNKDFNSSLVVYNKNTNVTIAYDGTFTFDTQTAVFDDIPLMWDMGINYGDSSVTLNFLDFIFTNIIKNNLFLLSVKTADISLDRITKEAFQLFNEALPANIYMLALFNLEVSDDFETTRIEESLSDERGFLLEDDYTGRVEDGHWGLAAYDRGLHWGPPAEAYFDRNVFHPVMAIIKRYVRCIE